MPVTRVDSQKNSPGTKDKFTLLTMPYNQRPLYLYGGQLQVNTGYKFAVRGKMYDSEGGLIRLKDNGTASVMHYFSAELKYGITDFLEMTLQSDYMKKGVRDETVHYWSGTDYMITVNNLTETRGMGDLLLQAAAHLPMEYKLFDIGLAGGIYLPVGRSETPQPEHKITDVAAANIYTINYHFKNVNGNGVPVYLMSAAGKLSVSKFTLSTDLTIKTPMKEGENMRWDYTLQTAKTFTYTGKPYSYLLNTLKSLNVTAHYQAAGWLDVYLNTTIFKSSGGWTEYTLGRYSNPDQSFIAIEPGMELQVSPAIKIYQRMSLPVSGTNADAPFYFYITLSGNMFLFLK